MLDKQLGGCCPYRQIFHPTIATLSKNGYKMGWNDYHSHSDNESDEDEVVLVGDEDVPSIEIRRRRMERHYTMRMKLTHSWTCCGGGFDSLGCTSGKSLCLGEEEIQHLIDENDDKRQIILQGNDDDDDRDDDLDFDDDDDDYVDIDRDWDESIGGDAKKWCSCGYKEGHAFYCCC